MVLSMRFSEEEVYLFGMALALVVSLLVSIPFIKVNLKWNWSHRRDNSLNDMVVLTLFGLLLTALLLYMLRLFFHYSAMLWLFIIGSCMEIVALYIYLKPVNHSFTEENRHSLSEEESKRVYLTDYHVSYRIHCSGINRVSIMDLQQDKNI